MAIPLLWLAGGALASGLALWYWRRGRGAAPSVPQLPGPTSPPTSTTRTATSSSSGKTIIKAGPTTTGWYWPVTGWISSVMGWRELKIYKGERKHHDGIDIAAPEWTPIHAPQAGEIVRIDRDGTDRGVYNGNAVWLQSGPYRIAMLHMVQVGPVTVGLRVPKGYVVGFVGHTGRSTGNHLHLQVYREGKVIDPLPLFGMSAHAQT